MVFSTSPPQFCGNLWLIIDWTLFLLLQGKVGYEERSTSFYQSSRSVGSDVVLCRRTKFQRTAEGKNPSRTDNTCVSDEQDYTSLVQQRNFSFNWKEILLTKFTATGFGNNSVLSILITPIACLALSQYKIGDMIFFTRSTSASLTSNVISLFVLFKGKNRREDQLVGTNIKEIPFAKYF